MNMISSALFDIAQAITYGPPSATADRQQDQTEPRHMANAAARGTGHTARRMTMIARSWLPGLF